MSIPMTDRIVADLKHDEGFKPFPYKDAKDSLSIGYGRSLSFVGITEWEAVSLLKNDVGRCITEVLAAFPVAHRLAEARLAVLVEMAYNLGTAGLGGFKQMFVALDAGDWLQVAAAMRDSDWRRQVGKRAERLAEMMETGQWA